MSDAIIPQSDLENNKNALQNNSHLNGVPTSLPKVSHKKDVGAMQDTIDFLSAICGSDGLTTEICFQVFRDVDPSKTSLPENLSFAPAKIAHKALRSAYPYLKKINVPANNGFSGVFFAVNETNGKGRLKKSISRIRALFVELDHGGLDSAHADGIVEHLGASIVVESSPGKYHVYWLLTSDGPGVSREKVVDEMGDEGHEFFESQFSQVQRLLQYRLKNMHAGVESSDVSRVLRVPGFYHLKNPYAPWKVRLHYCNADRRYTMPEVLGLCGITKSLIDKWKEEGFDDSGFGRSKRALPQAVKESIDPKYGEYLGVHSGNRNEAMYHYVYNHLLKHRGLNFHESLGAAMVANFKNEPPLDKSEISTIVNSAWNKFIDMGGFIGLPPGDAATVFRGADFLSGKRVAVKEGKIHSRLDIVGDVGAEGEETELVAEEVAEEVDEEQEELLDATSLEPTRADVDEMNRPFQYDYTVPAMSCPISDAAIVDRLVQRYGHRIGVSKQTGVYWYSRGLWQHDPAGGRAQKAMYPFITSLTSRIHLEPEVSRQGWFHNERGQQSPAKIASFRKTIHSLSLLYTIYGLLESRHDVAVDYNDFDKETGKIACRNGVVDLVTGERMSNSPRHKFTRTCSVRYDSEATCPRWDTFVSEIMGGDPELVDYLQKICGLVLAGDTSQQSLFLLYGTGGNGKSIFLGVLQELLGEFAGEFPTELVMKTRTGRDAGQQSSLAQAYGKRLMAVGEVDENSGWNESLIKSLSGEDRITAKFMHKNPFEYTPTYIVMVRANHKPRVQGADAGIWSRFKMVPFTQNFRGTEKQDYRLKDKLLEELPGIFLFCVEGYKKFLAEGLTVPQVAMDEIAEYQREMNPLRAFIDDFCEPCNPQVGVTLDEIKTLYDVWAIDSNAFEINRQTMGAKLKSMGLNKVRIRRGDEREYTFPLSFTELGKKMLEKLQKEQQKNTVRALFER